MLLHHLNRSSRQLWLCCALGGVFVAFTVRGQDYNPDWSRHFRIGAMAGLNISADFKMNGPFNISGSGQPGIFDDGYVLSSTLQNGYTSNWGYNNQSQNPPGTDILLMHRASSFRTSGSTQSDSEAFPGFDLAYGGNVWYWKRLRIGWDLGFGLLPISITANESLNGPVTEQVFSFSTGNPALPQAPYRGGSAGYGSSIRTNYVSSTDTGAGQITGKETLDVMLYTVRLGPSVYWDFNPYIGMSVGVGPAIGIVSGDLTYDERISIDGLSSAAHNTGKISGTDIVFGGYINATLMYHAVRNGDFYLSFQYMPMGTAGISGHGREARLKLDGQAYISAGVNWPF